jgi:hypothetical protein
MFPSRPDPDLALTSQGGMSNDYQNSVMKLIDLLLQCQPDDPYEFASRFFIDEQQPSHKLSHALHCLPYHDCHPLLFHQTACQIFCLENTEPSDLFSSPSSSSQLDTELISSEKLRRISSDLYGPSRAQLLAIFHELFLSFDSFTFPEFEYHLLSIVASIKFSDSLSQLIEEINPKSLEEFLAYYKTLPSSSSPFARLHDPSLASASSSSSRNLFDLSVVRGGEITQQKFVSSSLWNKIFIGNCVQIYLIERIAQINGSGRNNAGGGSNSVRGRGNAR